MNKKLIYSLLPLIGIILLAFIVRLLTILGIGPFYFDEIFSFSFAQKPILPSLQFWLWETNPPLHMALLKIWLCIFPANEFWARIPSLIFGTTSVYYIYLLTKRLFSKKLGLIVAFFLTITPYHIFISSINRGYSLLIFLVILSVYYFFIIFVFKKNSRKNKVLFALINILMLATHLTAIYIICGQIIILALKSKKEIKDYLVTNITPFIFWIFWFSSSLIGKINGDTLSGSWFMLLKLPFSKIIGVIQTIFIGPSHYVHGSIFIVFTLYILIFTMVKQVRKKELNYSYLYLFILTLIPIATTCFLKIWNIKFFVIAMPFLIIIIFYCIEYLFEEKKIIKLFIYLVILISLFSTNYNFLYRSLPIDSWDQLNKITSTEYNKDKKQILIYNNFIYRDQIHRYYTSKIKTLPYFDYKMSFNEAIIKKNYTFIKHGDERIKKWLESINVSQYDTVVLLQHSHVGKNIAPILEKMNFKQKYDAKKMQINDEPILVIYENNKTNTTTTKK